MLVRGIGIPAYEGEAEHEAVDAVITVSSPYLQCVTRVEVKSLGRVLLGSTGY